METTIIDKGNLHFFESMLLPEALNYLKNGSPIFALGLCDNGIACGALAGGPMGNIFHLSSFFVAPEYRGRGGGALLMNTLISCMKSQNQLYEIKVDFTIFNNDHYLFEGFLKHLDFTFDNSDETIYSVSLSSLADKSFFSEPAPQSEAVAFSKLPSGCIRELDKTMRATSAAPLPVPLEKAELDMDLSVAIMDGNRIDSFIAFDHSFAGKLTLAYAEVGVSGGASLSSMLREAYKNCVKKYSPETDIVVHTVHPSASALIHKLAANAKVISKTARLRVRDELL